ncbi:MAG: LPS export ABC transporter permease LptF [Gammaproteobacteria bacterium]|nr:LPS export ABC transporter permease LptF [Gammaproteobacteria bacterium]
MIVRRYIIVEIARYFATIAFGLFILVVSLRLTRYLADAAAGRIAADHITRLVMYKVGVSMKEVLPLSLYLGIFAGLTRLSRDNEIVAMRAAGYTDRHFYLATLTIALPLALLSGAHAMYGVPWLERELNTVEREARNEATIAGVRAGRFQELSEGDRVFYAEGISADDSALENAFVQVRDGSEAGLMRAARARVEVDRTTGARYAVFLDGTSYGGQPGSQNFEITRFNRYAVLIETDGRPLRRPDTEADSPETLLAANTLMARAELEYRIAIPVSVLVLAMLAVNMAQSRPGRFNPGIVSAIAIFFLYTNVIGMARALLASAKTPPAIGIWWVHLLVIALFALLHSGGRLLPANPFRKGNA